MRGRAGALAAVIALGAVGCGHAVGGTARPAKTAVVELPSEAEITDAVGNGLSSFGFQPFVGGTEIMPDGFRVDGDASPIRCIGVTETMLRVTYETADLIEAARQSYFTLDQGAEVSGADAAVVRFASSGAAQDRFDSFVRQWQGCDGQTVVKHLRGVNDADVVAAIGDVAVDDRLLTATVTTRQGADAPESHYTRAVSLRGATMVEVSLAMVTVGSGHAGSGGPAARVARVMLGKVGAHP